MKVKMLLLCMVLLAGCRSQRPGPLADPSRWSDTLSEQVTEAETQKPVPGITLLIKGTSRGVTSDANGRFQMSVPKNHKRLVLVAQSVGYVSRQIRPGLRRTLPITLKPDMDALNEVIIIGL